MRRTSATPCLLVLVLFTSTLGCVTGRSGKATNLCSPTNAHHTCQKTKPGVGVTHGPACGETLTSLPEECNLRGFLQSQMAVLPGFEIPSLSLHATGDASLPSRAISIASSIGSPQTDRGPPRS